MSAHGKAQGAPKAPRARLGAPSGASEEGSGPKGAPKGSPGTPRNRVSLMLDSGAFSAWRMGKRIDVKQYIEFCHANAGIIFKAVNVDVIPASPGVRPTTRQVEESAEQGWKNFVQMRRAGIDSIPVFHAGEDFKWLDKMLDSGVDYIGLSVSASRASKDPTIGAMARLDRMWSHICGSGGYPKVKVHGFMLTSHDVFSRYPWYSADSTSWVLGPSYGSLIVPVPKGDGWDYCRPPDVVSVANPPKNLKAYGQKGDPLRSLIDGEFRRELSAGVLSGDHYDHLGPRERAVVLKYLKECGYSLHDVRTQYAARCAIGALYYMNLLKHSPIKPFLTKSAPSIHDLGKPAVVSPHGTTEHPAWTHPRIFFGIPLANPHMMALTRIGAFDRLISYFYFEGTTGHRGNLERMVRTGFYRSTLKKES